MAMLTGCSTAPVALAPVGPDPLGDNTHAATGQLEVYSGLVGRSRGDDPAWFQHADYTIYQNGRRVEYVRNTTGDYAKRPHVISLPPGRYVVKTEAQDYLHVEVPVVIDAGRRTTVHLDNGWHPDALASKSQIVTLPSGHAVGWNAEAR